MQQFSDQKKGMRGIYETEVTDDKNAFLSDPITQITNTNVNFCLNCGAPVDRKSNFCIRCGKQISA